MGSPSMQHVINVVRTTHSHLTRLCHPIRPIGRVQQMFRIPYKAMPPGPNLHSCVYHDWIVGISPTEYANNISISFNSMFEYILVHFWV